MTTVSREIWRSLHAEELAANNEKWHIAGHPDLRIKICPDECYFLPHIHIEDMFTKAEEAFSLLDCKLVRSNNTREKFRKYGLSDEQVIASERFIQRHRRELLGEYNKYKPNYIDKSAIFENNIFNCVNDRCSIDEIEEEDQLEQFGDVVSLNEVKIIDKRDGFGIIIVVNSNDHTPPHMHVEDIQSDWRVRVIIPSKEPKSVSDIEVFKGETLKGSGKERILRALRAKVNNTEETVWQKVRDVWNSAHPDYKVKNA